MEESNRNEYQEMVTNAKEGEMSTDGRIQFSTDHSRAPNYISSRKPSLAARRAARAGLNAPTISTEGIRSANFSSSSSEIRSPYLTIPPGLSPTTLLDSPVFLSSSMAQISPTTGTFLSAQCSDSNSAPVLEAPEKNKDLLLEGINPQSSDLKTLVESNPVSFSSGGYQASTCIDSQLQYLPSIEASDSNRKVPTNDLGTELEEASVGVGAAPAEDGYNWRKYGQKQVKGSEYPRSYYKCTYHSCPVKKKVERNHDGQITEIVYKGNHNHPKPHPNRHRSSHLPFNDHKYMDHEAGTSTELYCENNQDREAIEGLSTLSSDEDEEEDQATNLCCDRGEGEETESKRRKFDACAMDTGAGLRPGREPRVVVQTVSEIDILDDGYRWRKYGQKVVKGNPNPRSYYKCTNPGCTVRKHIERASHDLKSVITTYEGKHNHEVPTAKSSGGQPNSITPTNIVTPSATQPVRAHETLPKFDGPPLAPFGLAGREQIGAAAATSFSFGVRPQSLVPPNLGMTKFSSLNLPSVHSYLLGQAGRTDVGIAAPKGEPMEEPVSDPGLPPMSNRSSVYYNQFVSRMHVGTRL